MKFIASCDAQTPIDTLKAVCEHGEDINKTVATCLSLIENHFAKDDEISSKCKESALKEFESTPTDKITCAIIQKKYGISYHIAWRLRDWLVKEKQADFSSKSNQ